MVYTLTMNPSLDYRMYFRTLNTGELNRAFWEMLSVGGKGINVSVVLNRLNVKNRCLGFIAGQIGCEIRRQLQEQGCDTDFIYLPEGVTRINVKAKEAGGRTTELNGQGPAVTEEGMEKLVRKIRQIRDGDMLILSGNVQNNVQDDIYGKLAELVKNRNVLLVVDAEKNKLFPTLKARPFLIKPNIKELSDMVGRELNDRADIENATVLMHKMGARNVLVSLGGDGAYFLGENSERLWIEAPKGTVIDTVGSGDAMVAGFVSCYLSGKNLTECAYYSVAAGSASAFSVTLPEKKDIESVFKKLYRENAAEN